MRATMTESGAQPAPARSGAAPRAPSSAAGRFFVVGRMIVFIGEFARAIGPRRLGAAALLVLLAGATEGLGLALLAPLIEILGDAAGATGRIGAIVRQVLGACGLPVSLPVLLAIFVGLIVLRAVVVALRDIVLARLNLDFAESLRRQNYRAIAGASWSFLMHQRLSDLLEGLTAQIDRVSSGTYFFLRLPALLVLGAAQLAIAFSLSPSLTLGVLGWGALLVALLQRRFGDRYGSGAQLAAAYRATFAEISDFLHALKLAKSHGAEIRHVAAFESAMARQSVQTTAYDRSAVTTRMAIQIGAAVTLGAFVYLGAAVAQVATPGLLVMVVIFSRLAPLVSELQQDWQTVAQMLPVFDGVIELRARCEAAAEPLPDAPGRLDVEREITLSGVGFRYDKERGPGTLEALDLVIPAGSTIAVVGPTGAGKSTLADLLLGLIAPDTGSVLIDGVPLAGPLLARWRRSVGYVPQDNFLFNDTIRANLQWAYPEAGEPDFQRALSIAAADTFVAALPDGLDTVIGERGVRLSGGERQRLGLARALLCRPTLLILDEATSALDSETERAVQAAIERLRGSMTIVMIAHRLTTVRGADRILVLDRGRVVQSGTWDRLVQDRQGRFAALSGELEHDSPPR